jgi:membrane-associated phospholipid phosphatase
MRVLATLSRGPGRRPPRGWSDFGVQLAIWLGFLLAYQVARGIADRGTDEAFANGRLLIDGERALGGLPEVGLQRLALDAGDWFVQTLNWTYWNSQFTVVGAVLLWIYFRHNDRFARLRNVLLCANILGLVGFVAMPTAPPRLFPELGFVDTLAAEASLNHGSGLIQLASNQFAAMPSLHSADSLIVGVAMALLCRSLLARLLWLLWPAWVWLTVMATANHWWLDVAAGIVLAGVAVLALRALERAAAAYRARDATPDQIALP